MKHANLQKLYQPSGWYLDAHKTMRAIAQASGASLQSVCQVTAALSPQVSVRRNLYAALALLSGNQDKPAGILGASWSKAVNGTLSGPKTEAFAANLAGDYEPVTLDVWAWRALGYETAPDARSKAGLAEWKRATASYKRAARALQVDPAECQAGVWCSIRVSAGYRYVTNPTMSDILREYAESGMPLAKGALACF